MWVSNGRAFAPPWISCRIGVSTSTKPRPLQRVADAAHDGRARVGDVAGLGADDQVDVAASDPGLGVGQALVLVGQRPQRLAGQRRRTRRRPTAHPRLEVTTSPVTPTWSPRSMSRRPVLQDLGPTLSRATITCRSPDPSRIVAKHSPPSSRLSSTRPVTETVVPVRVSGCRSPRLLAHLGEGVRARVADRVGVDAALLQPVELGATHPHLLGQPLDAQRLGQRDRARQGSGRAPAAAYSSSRGPARRSPPRRPSGAARLERRAGSGSPRRCRRPSRPGAGRRRTRSR